ncbi:6,7-dimethyl-8-ribityllumazine synthase [Iodidimonas sp. SYSU 1G8]|uniref:6,7-dimethyl-8-ribityllumazine synthase n=1 Tax=Iodidimonas sp. SYSU 1G8 TaxID=3133967 RepID=UPI0031FF06AC
MSDKPHLLVIRAPFYEDIIAELTRGATLALDEAGATYDVLDVPGAFEIPAAVAMAAASRKRYDGYVALGCVIRGETTHYDYVCAESARGLQELAYRDRLAIGFGVLTVENDEQAWARASVDRKNKGGEVAHAALRMIAVKREFGLA